MKKFQKIMVGLDLSAMDEILIRKVKILHEFLGFDKVYFIHVSKDLSLPDDVSSQYPDLLGPLDESIKAEILTVIKKQNFPPNIEIEVVVEEGNPRDTILRWAKIKNVDLMVMGRKEEMKGSGSLSKYMAQKAPCSIFFLTESPTIKIPKKILVPLDFSEHSVLTYSFAEKLSEQFDIQIIGLHLYEVPSGYYKTGKSFSEFDEIMKGHAKKDYDKFLEKNNLQPFACNFVLDEEGDAKEIILDEANKQNVDMILMGSRGRSVTAAVLLGSFAENLVDHNGKLPLMVFKKKGENMSFLDALFKI